MVWFDRRLTPEMQWDSRQFPLGAILDLPDPQHLDPAGREALRRLTARNSWVPIVTPSQHSAGVRRMVGGRVSVLGSEIDPNASCLEFEDCVEQLVTEDLPTPDDFIEYAQARLGGAAGVVVRWMLTESAVIPDSTLRSVSALLPPRDWWRTLQRQLKAQSLAALKGLTVVEMARELVVSPKLLASECSEVFQMSWAQSSALHWSARLERALRVRGLCGEGQGLHTASSR
jgi:hypothetical protein